MDPNLAAIAARQRGPFTRAQARDVGHSPKEIERLLSTGSWVALRRGVYVEGDRLTGRSARERHLLQADAASLVLRSDLVLSHRTAALAWDLPLLGFPRDVSFTLERQHRRRAPGLDLHTALTPSHHRTDVDGRHVTSVARTLSDVARSRSVTESVVLADAALHRGLCTIDDIAGVVRDLPVWRGIARTKRVLEFADRRSESPGESISRVAMRAGGIPAPDLQVELLLGGQRVRVDFMWPEHGLVGEFDGRVKYEGRDDVWNEKRREDLIRRHGYRVARWTWDDVYPSPDAMLRRVRRALQP